MRIDIASHFQNLAESLDPVIRSLKKEEGMKEIQSHLLEDIAGNLHECVLKTEHLTAIEEAKKEEQERMMAFVKWFSDETYYNPDHPALMEHNNDVAFEYWRNNVEGK